MVNFNSEEMLKNAELKAYNDGLFQHFNAAVASVECNENSVNDFLNYAFDLEIINGTVQFTDKDGDIHELVTSKGVTNGVVDTNKKFPKMQFV